MTYDFRVLVNGQSLKQGRVIFNEDRLNRQTEINVVLPNFDGYAEYLRLCEEAPTLDHVMFNWHKEKV